MTPTAQLPLLRMLLVGVAVPAALSWLNNELLLALTRGSVSAPVVFAVYVIEVGVLGLLAGGLIANPVLRWFIYGWSWAFLDLHVFVGTLELRDIRVLMLADSLYAAQIGLLVIWAILGVRPGIAIRWPIALVVSTGFIPFITTGNWILVLTQIVTLTTLAYRQFRQYRLLDTDTLDPAARPSTPQPVQFGVRHVLIWTTTIAVLLAIFKALNLLSLNVLRGLMRDSTLATIADGGFAAIVLIIALWAGLGRGPAWLRWPLPIAFPFLVGAAINFIHWLTTSPYGRFPGTQNLARVWSRMWHSNDQRITWLCLAGALLFAGLLFFRVQGVRLGRLEVRQ
jgi:hypothetical protein